jgi:sialate O-acetylesterase
MSAKPSQIDTFAIAGEDQRWYWANAVIKNDRVVVWSPNVADPVAVRYAWAMNPSQRNLLYNREGFPASPFRTDKWPLFDPDTDDIVEVNKPGKPDGYQASDWARPSMPTVRSKPVE